MEHSRWTWRSCHGLGHTPMQGNGDGNDLQPSGQAVSPSCASRVPFIRAKQSCFHPPHVRAGTNASSLAVVGSIIQSNNAHHQHSVVWPKAPPQFPHKAPAPPPPTRARTTCCQLALSADLRIPQSSHPTTSERTNSLSDRSPAAVSHVGPDQRQQPLPIIRRARSHLRWSSGHVAVIILAPRRFVPRPLPHHPPSSFSHLHSP